MHSSMPYDPIQGQGQGQGYDCLKATQEELTVSRLHGTNFLLLRSVCGTGNLSQQTSLQCLSTINILFSDNVMILIKSLYLIGYTAKRLTDKFPEKNWTKHGVNKLLKKLRDTGTVDRRPGSGRPRNARTEENVGTVNDLVLSQEDRLQTNRTVREISWEMSIHWCTENAICLHFLPYLLNICRKFDF